MDKFTREFNEHNALMKRVGSRPKTLKEYMRYRQGKAKMSKIGLPKSPLEATTLRREAPKYPSGDTYTSFVAPRREKQYTGTLIKGIAVTHKSNLVPVISQEQAEDIAKMRR